MKKNRTTTRARSFQIRCNQARALALAVVHLVIVRIENETAQLEQNDLPNRTRIDRQRLRFEHESL